MTFMGAGRILAYKPVYNFFTFPWILTNCHLARVMLCRACLINVKNLHDYAYSTSQNQVNHPGRTPLHASLHYTPKRFFRLMIVFLHDWSSHDLGGFKCLPARELIWQ